MKQMSDPPFWGVSREIFGVLRFGRSKSHLLSLEKDTFCNMSSAGCRLVQPCSCYTTPDLECLSVYTSIYASIYTTRTTSDPKYLSIYTSICTSIYTNIYTSIYTSIYKYVYKQVYGYVKCWLSLGATM